MWPCLYQAESEYSVVSDDWDMDDRSLGGSYKPDIGGPYEEPHIYMNAGDVRKSPTGNQAEVNENRFIYQRKQDSVGICICK